MEAVIITTYRCTNRCSMCNIWKYPTKVEEEFSPGILNKLPKLSFCNITGGEPFLRDDIEEIIYILKKKAKRVVVSTNGYLTEKIIDVAKKNKEIGIRVSLEGLSVTNDELRGIKGGFDQGLKTLLRLKELGLKDIGFAITVSSRNAKDMLELYQLSKAINVEFATAVVHNSYYFHKYDNRIEKRDEVIVCFEELIEKLLKTKKVKNWYRAYFNYGLINYIKGRRRLLPCPAARDVFFLDPWGKILPCNGMEESLWYVTMGNLTQESFEEIWASQQAEIAREKVKNCPKNCWMVGNVSPAIKRNILKPTIWVVKNRLKILVGKRICLD
jgi:radical SAM protein with 4Fe4S-binding SPASM domain